MFNCCYGKHERILTCCWDYLGGGGDALAKFEPKDVPTMSMTITSVGSNSNACASLNIIWHRNRIELNFTSFLSRIKQSDMFCEEFLSIFTSLIFTFSIFFNILFLLFAVLAICICLFTETALFTFWIWKILTIYENCNKINCSVITILLLKNFFFTVL